MNQKFSTYHLKLFVLSFIIAVAVLTAYWKTGNCDFINYDDSEYVADNNHVHQGITIDNIRWAFSFDEEAVFFYYHPFTWLSYMLDAQLFGLNAKVGHIMNAVIHGLNAILLFLLFYRMTGAVWKSALVAFLFAAHPINVESVVWVSERKNVLSSLFWLLTMHAYTSYARHPGFKRYIPILIFFILGSLSKPMLVTLPFVLLLMDVWPLKRLQWLNFGFPDPDERQPVFQETPAGSLILEKLPLFILSLISIGISIFSVHYTGQILTESMISYPMRLSNAVVIYIKYIIKLLLPHDLAIFYPFPLHIPSWQIAGAAVLLIIITVSVIWLYKKAPYLSVGWFWYLGTLFPIIGIFQSGKWPEMADRWVYIPEIGFFIMLIWGGNALFNRLPYKRIVAPAILGIIIVLLIMATQNQAAYWKDSKTLFQHTLDVTENNPLAHFNLGSALSKEGNCIQALAHYTKALPSYPDNPIIQNNIGTALARTGHPIDAIIHFKKAILFSPDYVDANFNLANALVKNKEMDAAIEQYKKVLSIDPNHIGAQKILKKLSAFQNEFETAKKEIQDQLDADPDNPTLHYKLGRLYESRGMKGRALESFQAAADLKPDFWEALYQQAIILVKQKEYNKSIGLFKQIVSLRPENTSIYYNIACIYSLQNKKTDAVDWLKKAMDAGYDNLSKIKADPDLENIRQTPYYRQLTR